MIGFSGHALCLSARRGRRVFASLSILAIFVALVVALWGGNHSSARAGEPIKAEVKPIPAVGNPCARPKAGGIVQNPPDIYSNDGKLSVDLSYQTIASQQGPFYCFMTPDGMENPTLHLNPGDTLTINLTNNVPHQPNEFELDPPHCGAKVITDSSVNLHFHGLNVSPACHSDNVIRTMVNWGQVFTYTIKIPEDEPPGLYFYHPSVHGLIDDAMLGGATGVIVVEGIEQLHPEVAGLEHQILLVRDQNFPKAKARSLPDSTDPDCTGANNDLTINFIAVGCPAGPPAATIQMKAGPQQFWRVVNASGDDVIDLRLQYDGAAQTMKLLALDGTPLPKDSTVSTTDILLAPGNRAEFLVSPPDSTVRSAKLITLSVNDGPDGSNYPQRTLAAIEATTSAATPDGSTARAKASSTAATIGRRFAGLTEAPVTTTRRLYFSEDFPGNPGNLFNFFITVDGATPTSFFYDDAPVIVTYQGAIEEWTIENRSMEGHVFHIHPSHFIVESMDHFPLDVSRSYERNQLLDTIFVPGWNGSEPYPSVKLKMDFRRVDLGESLYHCHLSFHEDNRMIAAIEVTPSRIAAMMLQARNYLGSLRWRRGQPRTKPQEFAAWCVRGRIERRGESGSERAPASKPDPATTQPLR